MKDGSWGVGVRWARLLCWVGVPAVLLLGGCGSMQVADAGGMHFRTWQDHPLDAPFFDTGARLHRVAYRLRLGAARWCEKDVHHETGIVYWNDAVATGFGDAGTVATLPRGGQPTVLSVAPDSAAGRAGVRPGDVVEQVDGVTLAGDAQGLQQLAAWRRTVAASPRATTLQLRRGGAPLGVTLVPDLVCDVDVGLGNERRFEVDLSAERRVVVSRGAVDLLDDDSLAFVLAHAASHLVLRHDNAALKNAAMAADLPFFVAGVGLAIASMGAYPQAAAMPLSTLNDARLRALEPEADLWGLAMTAAAGFDIGRPAQLPVIDDLRYVSETTAKSPARTDRLVDASARILEWQRAGQALVPDRALLKTLATPPAPGAAR